LGQEASEAEREADETQAMQRQTAHSSLDVGEVSFEDQLANALFADDEMAD